MQLDIQFLEATRIHCSQTTEV